jgi:hypothetical protein
MMDRKTTGGKGGYRVHRKVAIGYTGQGKAQWLIYHSGIFLEELSKTLKSISQHPAPPK